MLNELDIIPLQFLTVGICFPFQLQPGLLQMLIDVCFFGDHLDLEFDRADL
ncbi:unknown [Dorea longicatena CAG:42]|nr:unknown [Dorea longicatena CAG:42]